MESDLDVITSVTEGGVSDQIVYYLATKEDNKDKIDIVLSCIERRGATKRGKLHTFVNKDARLITGLVVDVVHLMFAQSNNSSTHQTTYEKTYSFVANLLTQICKQHLNFVGVFYEEVTVRSEDPSCPAAAFIRRLLMKLLFEFALKNDTACKLQVLAVKFIAKEAVATFKRHEFLRDVMAGLETKFGRDVNKLKTVVLSYLHSDEDHRLAAKAYEVMWRSATPVQASNDPFAYWTEEDAQAALGILADILFNESFFKYVKLILLATSNSKKQVQSEACKSIGDLIIAVPSILSEPLVINVFKKCLTTADARAAASLVAALCQYLTSAPSPVIFDQYSYHLARFMGHQAMSVRVMTLNSISALLTAVPNFPQRQELELKAFSLILDPEPSVQQAACRLFSEVYCDSSQGTALVKLASFSPQGLNFLPKIMSQLVTMNSAICQSQAPKLALEAKKEDSKGVVCTSKDDLKMLCKAVAAHLHPEEPAATATAAVGVLHAFAQVHPDVVIEQVDDLIGVMSRLEPTSSVLRGVICKTFVILSSIMADDHASAITKCTEDAINTQFDEISTFDFTQLLRLLVHICKDPHQIKSKYLDPSLDILRTSISVIDKNNDCIFKQKVKRALCLVIYLWKEYDDCNETRRLILEYLRHSKYNFTVLQVLCEARKEYVSSYRNAYLNKLIAHYLRCSDPDLVVAALKLIYSTIFGYNIQYQNPEMKQVGDSSAEAVSQMLQDVIDHVSSLLLVSNVQIRQFAGKCIQLMTQSGLILMNSLIPHLIAMTTDTNCNIRVYAMAVLPTIAETWNIGTCAARGLELAYELQRIQQPALVRGFVFHYIAVCHQAYTIVEKSPEKFKSFIHNIADKLETVSEPRLALFFIDQLLYCPYKTVGQVQYVATVLANIISLANNSVNTSLLKRAEEHFEVIYRSALKSTPKKNAATIGKVTFLDFITPEIENAIKQESPELPELLRDKDEIEDGELERQGIRDSESVARKKKHKQLSSEYPTDEAMYLTPSKEKAKNLNSRSSTKKSSKRSNPHAQANEEGPLSTPVTKKGQPSQEEPLATPVRKKATPIQEELLSTTVTKKAKPIQEEPLSTPATKKAKPIQEEPLATPVKKKAKPIQEEPPSTPATKKAKPIQEEPLATPVRKRAKPIQEEPLSTPATKKAKPIQEEPHATPVRKKAKPIQENPLLTPATKKAKPIQEEPLSTPATKKAKPIQEEPPSTPATKKAKPIQEEPLAIPVRKKAEPIQEEPLSTPATKKATPIQEEPPSTPATKKAKPIQEEPFATPVRKRAKPIQEEPLSTPATKKAKPIQEEPLATPVRKRAKPIQEEPPSTPATKKAKPIQEKPLATPVRKRAKPIQEEPLSTPATKKAKPIQQEPLATPGRKKDKPMQEEPHATIVRKKAKPIQEEPLAIPVTNKAKPIETPVAIKPVNHKMTMMMPIVRLERLSINLIGNQPCKKSDSKKRQIHVEPQSGDIADTNKKNDPGAKKPLWVACQAVDMPAGPRALFLTDDTQTPHKNKSPKSVTFMEPCDDSGCEPIGAAFSCENQVVFPGSLPTTDYISKVPVISIGSSSDSEKELTCGGFLPPVVGVTDSDDEIEVVPSTAPVQDKNFLRKEALSSMFGHRSNPSNRYQEPTPAIVKDSDVFLKELEFQEIANDFMSTSFLSSDSSSAVPSSPLLSNRCQLKSQTESEPSDQKFSNNSNSLSMTPPRMQGAHTQSQCPMPAVMDQVNMGNDTSVSSYHIPLTALARRCEESDSYAPNQWKSEPTVNCAGQSQSFSGLWSDKEHRQRPIKPEIIEQNYSPQLESDRQSLSGLWAEQNNQVVSINQDLTGSQLTPLREPGENEGLRSASQSLSGLWADQIDQNNQLVSFKQELTGSQLTPVRQQWYNEGLRSASQSQSGLWADQIDQNNQLVSFKQELTGSQLTLVQQQWYNEGLRSASQSLSGLWADQIDQNNRIVSIQQDLTENPQEPWNNNESDEECQQHFHRIKLEWGELDPN